VYSEQCGPFSGGDSVSMPVDGNAIAEVHVLCSHVLHVFTLEAVFIIEPISAAFIGVRANSFQLTRSENIS
jgi:hypothetical protein